MLHPHAAADVVPYAASEHILPAHTCLMRASTECRNVSGDGTCAAAAASSCCPGALHLLRAGAAHEEHDTWDTQAHEEHDMWETRAREGHDM
eukprot:250153-Chlamydomonas_euryale.AAC.1